MRMWTRVWSALATFLIAGCARPDAGAHGDAGADAPDPVGAGVADKGAASALLPLTAEQLQSPGLPGELACAYSLEGATVLLARADVLADGDVRAAMHRNGVVELLGNTQAGGFNDLLDGITLTGDGLTVTVTVARHADLPTGNESTAHAATLTIRQAGGERSYPGTWNCGP